MRKIILVFASIILLCVMSVSVSAYDFFDDVKTDFFCTDSTLYLTETKKAGDVAYFGERITIADKDGNKLSADDYISTGCTLHYFESFDIFRIVLVGDINCDGKITASDARIALRMSAGLYTGSESPDKYGASDTNYSGTLEASDAREILRKAAQISDFEKFKANVEKDIYSEEKTVPADRDYYSVGVILYPDFADNSERLNPEFYGDSVAEVKEVSANEVELILVKPDYEIAMKLYSELKSNNAVLLGVVVY
ncbi:MAG: hypothetical protein IKV76_09655 [Clostridia bacterium]|nr:hypothetical protein [Clostridia bacterium]